MVARFETVVAITGQVIDGRYHLDEMSVGEVLYGLRERLRDKKSIDGATVEFRSGSADGPVLKAKLGKYNSAEIGGLGVGSVKGLKVEFLVEDMPISKDGQIGDTNIYIDKSARKFFSIERPKYSKVDEYGLVPEEYYMDRWTLVADKSGGAQGVGPLGGVYKRGRFRVLFKRESKKPFGSKDPNEQIPKPGNIITEYVVAKIFEKMIPDYSARIILATPSADTKIPDETGENVYLGSIFLDNYQDLFEAIGLKKRGYARGAKEAIKKKFGRSSEFRTALLDGTFKGFEKGGAASLLVGDFDVHAGNFGAITEYLEIKGKDVLYNGEKIGKLGRDEIVFSKPLYGKVGRAQIEGDVLKYGDKVIGRIDEGKIELESKKLSRIDYGAALDNLENEIHPHSRTRHPFGKGPTNHFREYPRALRVSPEMAEEIDRISKIDLMETLDQAMDEVAKYYGIEPLKAFANHLGMNIKELGFMVPGGELKPYAELTPEEKEGFKKTFIDNIKIFLRQKIQSRQRSLKNFGTEIKIDLCLRQGFEDRWELQSYWSDVDQRFVSFKEVVLDNPEYFQELVDGKRKVHFREKLHQGNFFERWFLKPFGYKTSLEKLLLKEAARILGMEKAKSSGVPIDIPSETGTIVTELKAAIIAEPEVGVEKETPPKPTRKPLEQPKSKAKTAATKRPRPKGGFFEPIEVEEPTSKRRHTDGEVKTKPKKKPMAVKRAASTDTHAARAKVATKKKILPSPPRDDNEKIKVRRGGRTLAARKAALEKASGGKGMFAGK